MHAENFHFNTVRASLSKNKFFVLLVIFSLLVGIEYPYPAITEENISSSKLTCENELPGGQEMRFDLPLHSSSTTIPGQKIVVVIFGTSLADSGFRTISISVLQKIVYSKKYSSLVAHHSNLRLKLFQHSPLISQLQI